MEKERLQETEEEHVQREREGCGWPIGLVGSRGERGHDGERSEGVREATSQGRQVAGVHGEAVPSHGGALAVFGVRSIVGDSGPGEPEHCPHLTAELGHSGSAQRVCPAAPGRLRGGGIGADVRRAFLMTGHGGPSWLGRGEQPAWVGLAEPDDREDTRLLKAVQGRGPL